MTEELKGREAVALLGEFIQVLISDTISGKLLWTQCLGSNRLRNILPGDVKLSLDLAFAMTPDEKHLVYDLETKILRLVDFDTKSGVPEIQLIILNEAPVNLAKLDLCIKNYCDLSPDAKQTISLMVPDIKWKGRC